MPAVKVQVNGQWVPISSGNTWNTAWGIVAPGDTTNAIVSLDSTPRDLTTVITFTGVVGRRYVIKYSVRAIAGSRLNVTTTSPGSSVTGHVDLYLDGSLVTLGDSWFEAEISYGGRDFEWIFVGDGASHTYQLRGVMSTGTCQFHNQSTAGNAYFYIEDKGPLSIALPAPSGTLMLGNTNAVAQTDSTGRLNIALPTGGKLVSAVANGAQPQFPKLVVYDPVAAPAGGNKATFAVFNLDGSSVGGPTFIGLSYMITYTF